MTATATAATVPLTFGAPSAEAAPQARPDLLHVGSWNGGQVYGVAFDPVQGVLTPNGPVAQVSSGWVTAHPDRPLLYVGSQRNGGIVTAFAVDRTTGAPAQLGEVSTDDEATAGGGLSYLGVDRSTDTLLVANFEAAWPLRSRSAGTAHSARPCRSWWTPDRGPATSVGPAPAPGGRRTRPPPRPGPDFGADRVFVHGFDGTTGALSPGWTGPGAHATDAGAGPRRLVFHPDGRKAHLLTELTAEHPHPGRPLLRRPQDRRPARDPRRHRRRVHRLLRRCRPRTLHLRHEP
ncbi:beta-propeller fold lactonase family protein [Streptomyces sp. MBT53]|uniref:lactonase family protein n=1 Tax=Streptomyces sp. MBT53 TaxID=1488384 RepID=UPI001F3BE1DF|nr:beta-propeller fold lactonase family protein [Streptomyces sp. MBT53]